MDCTGIQFAEFLVDDMSLKTLVGYVFKAAD